jgi:hypothetical protein
MFLSAAHAVPERAALRLATARGAPTVVEVIIMTAEGGNLISPPTWQAHDDSIPIDTPHVVPHTPSSLC